MRALIKKHESKLRFALIGGINTAIDFALLLLLSSVGVNKYIANFISTSVAFIFSFFANRTFTFKSSGSAKREFIPFLLVTLSGLWVLQPAIIWASTPIFSSLDQNAALFMSKLIATIASLIWNYVLYSRVVFRNDR